MGDAPRVDLPPGCGVATAAEHDRRPFDPETGLDGRTLELLQLEVELERGRPTFPAQGQGLRDGDPRAPDRGMATRDQPPRAELHELVGARDRVAELGRGGRGGPRRRRGVERQDPDQPGATLEGIVGEAFGQSRLLDPDGLMDGGRATATSGPIGAVGGAGRRHEGPLVLAQERVIRLGSTPKDSGQGVPDGSDIPGTDPGALGEIYGHDLARVGEADLVNTVHVQVAEIRPDERAGRRLGDVLGGDEMLEGRETQVRRIDAAEQPVPVTVVRLATVQVVERAGAGRPCRHGLDELGGSQHLLVEVVDLAVLDLEVAPRGPAQPARFRPAFGLGLMEQARKDQALVRRQGPFAHLGVRPGRHVDPADRWVRREPGRWHGRREPVGVRLEGGEEPLDPGALAPAMRPGRRPGAELLAVVAHRPEPLSVLGGVFAQVADDFVDVPERDPVAKALLRPEDAHDPALVLGRVRPPEGFLGDGRGPEVGIVEDRPFVARGSK